MADTAQERTEEATLRKRQEARRKGTVTRSAELTSALVVFALLLALPWAASSLGESMVLSMNHGLSSLPGDVRPSTIGAFAWELLRPSLAGLGAIAAVSLVVGIAVNFAQVGFVLSAESMNPSLSKINPLAGMKRLFSTHSAVEGAKACLKSLLFGYLAYSSIRDHWSDLLGLASLPPLASLVLLGNLLKTIFLRVAVAWLALAVLDYLFQRNQVAKQLRMTKDELRQEMKDLEASPELRMAIAQRRRKLSRGRMMSAVEKADVVVTNPSHYAIAIRYDPKKMHAPQVVAKGADYMAARIREVAAEHRVPLVPNPPLARQLYKRCEVGEFVPRELFQAVAEILAYVYSTLRGIRQESTK